MRNLSETHRAALGMYLLSLVAGILAAIYFGCLTAICLVATVNTYTAIRLFYDTDPNEYKGRYHSLYYLFLAVFFLQSANPWYRTPYPAITLVGFAIYTVASFLLAAIEHDNQRKLGNV